MSGDRQLGRHAATAQQSRVQYKQNIHIYVVIRNMSRRGRKEWERAMFVQHQVAMCAGVQEKCMLGNAGRCVGQK